MNEQEDDHDSIGTMQRLLDRLEDSLAVEEAIVMILLPHSVAYTVTRARHDALLKLIDNLKHKLYKRNISC